MAHYKMSDVAVEVNDRENNPANSQYERFVGLEHYVSGEVIIRNYGSTQNLESTMKIFQSGDILVARRNVYLKRAATVDFDGLTSGDSIVLRAKNPVIGRILPFVLNTDAFWDFADQYSDGTMSKRLSPKTLMTYEFDLPNEDELESFADLLWAANDARESYQELLRQTDELVKSQFIELFGDIPVEDYKSLSEVCKIITDGTHQPPKFVDKGIPFLLVSNITGNIITYDTPKYITQETYDILMKRTPIEIGDILLSTVGSYGHPAIVKDNTPFSFQRHIAYLKPDVSKINSVYLHTAILSEDVQNQIEVLVLGVAQKTLNLSAIRGIKIPVPSLERQLSFNTLVEQTDKSKFEIKKAIENTSALIKSLMQQDLST